MSENGYGALRAHKASSDVTESARTECSHTPGPWKASEENVGGGFNIYAGPLRVAHTSIQARVFKPEQRLLDESEAKANGRLIVRAVNSHDALVRELQAVLEWALVEKAPLREQEIASIRSVLLLAQGGE